MIEVEVHICLIFFYWVRVMGMVFNATFNNIAVKISWRSVLLVEETGVPRENH
jgi:energy-converting hydrogenase Eha subunit E